MLQFPRGRRAALFFALALSVSSYGLHPNAAPNVQGNRLTYLDDVDPFYPNLAFPKLTTPQWVGETGVDAVVIVAIDDMKEVGKYETVLRPILDRLKQIDGRAPVSIMCTGVDPKEPQLQRWLREGLSLEVHTLTHPCPFLAKSNFVAAVENYQGGVELLNRIAGNRPVAFRMPCCDSINSPSPRFYAEIFNRTNRAGQFLTLDSSVMNILTPKDSALPREWVLDAQGGGKFEKYVPFPAFATTIEDYPYPYVIGKLCWEFPAMVPSDWEAQHVHGTNNPVTVADWERALDATVLKQGTFTFIFHPHGWIRPDQMVQFIDYAVAQYGRRVKFLNFREAEERLRTNLLVGQSLRAGDGADNGVRLVDLNNDGYLDVVIGNGQERRTRLWLPRERRWQDSEFPTTVLSADDSGHGDAGVRFGIVEPDGFASILVNNERTRGAWHFDGVKWAETKSLLVGLDLDGQPIHTSQGGRDRGVRFRDLDGDGRCELILGNEAQNAVFAWSAEDEAWKKLGYALPPGTAIVDAQGRDNGLRFVDVNDDGHEDVLFSNGSRYSLHLFVPEAFLGFPEGWSRPVLTGLRGEFGEIPMIVRDGPWRNNGAWFHARQLWVQNEETSGLPDYVEHRPFGELLRGLQPKAKTPQESLAAMRVRPGFKVELVASEPLVKDPIAFEWGADGRLWVVEMGDYPLGTDGRGKHGGIVRFLEDTNGDGRYDKSTVFLEGIGFPTGVMPWGRGVLISAAPEIFYAEDRDGDGKADVHITLFQGFREGNQQHRVNGFEYGLDNWIYGANGDSGGQVQSMAALLPFQLVEGNRNAGLSFQGSPKPAIQEPIDLRGHDFRFRPADGRIQTVSGQTQYGRHRDDWGNWFGNNNPTWLWHVFLPEQDLARNPFLPVRTVKEYLANYAESTRVYPISRTMQRFNDVSALNHVTSANSATPYRDDLFGPDFATSVFISEPVHNTVHREILEPDGVTFTSHRAADELEREFLASTDNWFRPTMLKTGPDGALYIADMYRLVIEHPEWIPLDSQKELDLRAGADQGRLYRVYPEGAQLRPIPDLSKLAPEKLVQALDSPNGWTRDTVQRLLVQAQDTSAAPSLALMAAHSARAKVRVQALCILEGLGKLTPAILNPALADPDAAVREQAVRLSEPFLGAHGEGQGSNAPDLQALKEHLLQLVNDSALRVRNQLAFSLGEWSDARAGHALVELAMRDGAKPHFLTAVLSSAVPHVKPMLEAILHEHWANPPVDLLQNVLGLAVMRKEEGVLADALVQISRRTGPRYQSWQFTALAGFLDAAERQDGSLVAFARRASTGLKPALTGLSGLFDNAREVALDSSLPGADRLHAVPLLGRGLTDEQRDPKFAAELLRPQVPDALQKAAISNLGRRSSRAIAELLLQGWRAYEPAVRIEAVRVLLSRPESAEAFLGALESGAIPPAQISPPDQQKLLASSQESVRARAQKLFSIAGNRRQLLKEYHSVLELTGDPSKGALLFRQNCVPCHRLHGEGTEVGPDLGALANKSGQTLLIAILDPNQAVEARYVNYTAVTQSDREVSGIIAAETPSSVTLRTANGVEETILRTDLKELSSSGLSLMPEGFEKVMDPQGLADLIAFLRSGS